MGDEAASVRRGMDYARDSDAAGQPTTAAVTVVRSALTGARPLLAACDDGHSYWIKGPDNPHGNLSLAHEWVLSELSRAIGGPLAPGVLVDVDPELLGDWRIDGVPRTAGTWFGSRLVTGDEATALQHARRDGNPQRIPYYLALWHLCLGIDAQFVFERAHYDRLWSIDHGLWFDNGASDWTTSGGLDPVADSSWDDPDWEGSRALDATACHAAAAAVEALSGEVLGEIMGTVPLDWGIGDDDLEHLALFILTRRPIAAAQLRTRANHC